MTLAVVAAMANSPSIIRNVGSWRVKETERMKAIVTELQKLGVEVRGVPDTAFCHLARSIKRKSDLLAIFLQALQSVFAARSYRS